MQRFEAVASSGLFSSGLRERRIQFLPRASKTRVIFPLGPVNSRCIHSNSQENEKKISQADFSLQVMKGSLIFVEVQG